jgi:hypothetical protein
MDYEQTRIPKSAQADIATAAEPKQELHELAPDPRTAQAHLPLQPGSQAVQQTEGNQAAELIVTRPDDVYLYEPVVLFGITIRYSEQGCRYLIQHWQAVLQITDDKRTDKAHIRMLIENWKQYIELYERSREA